MRKSKIASVVSLTILSFGMTSLLANQPIVNEHHENNNSTPSFSVESAFKSITSDDKPLTENSNQEITIIKEDGITHMSNVDEDEHNKGIEISNDGISISNVDENGNQILFVKAPKYDDLNWQMNIQATDVDYVELAEFMNKGYSVDRPAFADGNNMLLLASMQQRESLLNFAINNGANLAYNNKQGQNAYHWAANGYNPVLLQNLLDKNKTTEVLNKSDNLGKTPLHFAAASGNPKIVDMLLANQADISAKDKDGRSPLFYALVNGRYDIATLLIKKGSDLTLVDNVGVDIEELILNSNISMYQLSYSSLPKNIQEKIIKNLKDAPQIAYKLVNPSITFEKIEKMEKHGISIDEDILS